MYTYLSRAHTLHGIKNLRDLYFIGFILHAEWKSVKIHFPKNFFPDGEQKKNRQKSIILRKEKLSYIIIGKDVYIILSGVAVRNNFINFHIGKGKRAHPYQ